MLKNINAHVYSILFIYYFYLIIIIIILLLMEHHLYIEKITEERRIRDE